MALDARVSSGDRGPKGGFLTSFLGLVPEGGLFRARPLLSWALSPGDLAERGSPPWETRSRPLVCTGRCGWRKGGGFEGSRGSSHTGAWPVGLVCSLPGGGDVGATWRVHRGCKGPGLGQLV